MMMMMMLIRLVCVQISSRYMVRQEPMACRKQFSICFGSNDEELLLEELVLLNSFDQGLTK
jgi:hypothetical protein